MQFYNSLYSSLGTLLVLILYIHPLQAQKNTLYNDSRPNYIKIYDQMGDPVSLLPFSSDTVPTDNAIQLVAKVFTESFWHEEYETDPELGNKIKWSFVDAATGLPDTTIGHLFPDSSVQTYYVPKKPFYSVDITATLETPDSGTVTETIRFYQIGCNLHYVLFIEATNDFNQSNPFDPCPWDSIFLMDVSNKATAYAILRDSLDNWIYPATNAVWSSSAPEAVSVTPGPSDSAIIQGILPERQVTITATDHAHNTMYSTTVFTWHTSIKNDISLNQQAIHIIQKKHPNRTSVTLLFSSPVRNIDVSMVSINGKTVAYSSATNTRQISLHAQHSATGVYILHIKGDDKEVLHKKLLLFP